MAFVPQSSQSILITLVGITISSAAIMLWYTRQQPNSGMNKQPDSDPGLLRKHSSYKSYNAAGFNFSSIRTFYHPHPQAKRLPTEPTVLPLFVFIHGLGGSVAQFSPLLTSLINVAPCLAIDLPGCGLSAFNPTTPAAYKLEVLATLIAEAIAQHRDTENNQKIVLVGHSLGCSLAALIASPKSPLAHPISNDVWGFVAICPRAEPLTDSQASSLKYVSYIPAVLFDAFRYFDKYRGTESASVIRFVGKDADEETKRLQVRFNAQSRSAVFLNMLSGMSPVASAAGSTGGLPGQYIWSAIGVPIFCLAAEQDHVCPPLNVELIAQWFGSQTPLRLDKDGAHSSLPVAAGETPLRSDKDEKSHDSDLGHRIPITRIPDLAAKDGPPSAGGPPRFAIKTAVLPSPASHGFLYATSTVRILSGLIQSFASSHVDHRLSLGWQLQHLTIEGKWDVKNLEKWKRIEPISEPIGGVFRAMKTLREVDEQHTPKVFTEQWGAKAGKKQGVRMVIDISHESPVYDPKGLEQGGIEYYKFPTVSKLPPAPSEVSAFIALVDTLRDQLATESEGEDAVIAVHCHYGFNRTGFFIISYMVERMGYRLQDALELFAKRRAPGIRHEHFVNELYVRHSVGLQRRPTLT